MLKVWNERLTNPMSIPELHNIIKFYERGYIFTCNDDIKAHFCINTCHLYKSKDISEDYIYQGNDYLSRYIEDMKASKDNYIYMEQMFSDWPLVAIKPGYVIVLAGGPGSGKTTFMLNMMKSFKHLKWLFLSIEMTGVDITDKFLKITETNWDDDISIQTFKNSMNHIITIDKPNIHIDEIKDYVNMMRSKTGIKPNAIVIDYLTLIAAKGNNQTERAIYISRILKQIAKELRIVIFVLSQVPKELAGDGNLPLGLDAPKDSGEVVNMADMLRTCWRPNRNRGGGIEDNVFKLGIPKNRHGVAGYSMEFEFIGEKYQIKSKHGEK
jgi:replicative DNA helicase